MEAFDYLFFKLALGLSLIIGLLAGSFSVFVVQKKMAFLGSGLAHSSFGGIALGIFLGFSPYAVGALFTLLVALGIFYFKRISRASPDSLIGIFFSASMALGVVLLSFEQSFSRDAVTYLFGSILAVNKTDFYLVLGFFVFVAFLYRLWGRLSFESFDEELALSNKLSVQRDELIFMLLLALFIILSIKILGIVLLAAVLVIPGAFARSFCQSFSTTSLVSIGFATLTLPAGIIFSYFLNWPSGASIVLLQTLLFFGALGLKRFF